MTIPFELIAEKVVDTLMAGNYEVELYDDQGNLVFDKRTARKFFTNPGRHMISIHDDGDNSSHLKVALSSPVNIKEFEAKVGNKLRAIATQTGDNMSYDIRTFGKELTPKDFAHEAIGEEIQMTDVRVNEGLEKMTGTSRSSYQRIGECRLIIRHTDRVNENKFGARSRNIQAIYVETKAGERFRMAENSLHGARAMARHISNGGIPFDTVGSKITEMVTEMAQLRDMVKEARSLGKDKSLSEDAGNLVEQVRNRYIEMRETLRKMTGKMGYFTHTAGLQEDERVDELEYDLTDPADIKTAKQYGRDTAIKRPGTVGAPMPTSGSSATRADIAGNEREEAIKYYFEKTGTILRDDPESAQLINSILKSPDFQAWKAAIQHKEKEKATQDEMPFMYDDVDEFDDAMIHEYQADDQDAPHEFDPSVLPNEANDQIAYLMGEVLSATNKDPRIKRVKDTLALTDDQWVIWSRAIESMQRGQELQGAEKAAHADADKHLSAAGFGPFDAKTEGRERWGPGKSDAMHDRYLDDIENPRGKDDTQAPPGSQKKREPDRYDTMAADADRKAKAKAKKESFQEAEAEGKISSETQKYTYTSNVSEFDRPTGGKKAHDTNYIITDLSRDNAENMHSDNIVEKTLPEYTMLESWFDDMVRVDFFNEEAQDDENIDEKWHKGKKKTQEDDADSINEAFDRLNFSKTAEEFDGFLKEYVENGILEQILELVQEDSNLWQVIQERRPMVPTAPNAVPTTMSPVVEPEEQRLQKAFLELSTVVNERSKSLEQAIQELAQDFMEPENAANQLHQMAMEAGLAKNDFGSTMADDLLSPNQEVERGKEENQAEEFYGRPRFGEGVDNARIQELAGISHEEHLHEEHKHVLHENLGCGCADACICGGHCGGKCGDENCPCECGERTGKGLNECRLSNVTMEEIEPDLDEQFTDQNLARIIQLSKYRNGL